MKKFKILAIDGGGVRGIVPVLILEELESDSEFDYLNDYRWTMRYSTNEEVKQFNEQIKSGKIRCVDENISGKQIQ